MRLPFRNFDMTSGDYRTLTVTVRDDAGAIVDLTGATIDWGLGKSQKDCTLVTKTSGSGIASDDPTSGVFVVTLEPDDTADLCGRYYHAGQVTDASGRPVTVVRGWATIDGDLV